MSAEGCESIATCTTTAPAPCTLQSGQEKWIGSLAFIRQNIYPLLPARIAEGRLLPARRLRVFRGRPLELLFQCELWRSAHGTPHAKGTTGALVEPGSHFYQFESKHEITRLTHNHYDPYKRKQCRGGDLQIALRSRGCRQGTATLQHNENSSWYVD